MATKIDTNQAKDTATDAQAQYFRITDQVPQAVWYWAALIALEQLQIAPALINVLFTAIVGAVALAFGLGGRETAARWLNRTENAVGSIANQVDAQQKMDQARSTAQMQAYQMRPWSTTP